MRFAVIGTGAIVEKFLSAGSQVPDFSLYAVYSRTKERGQAFAAAHGAQQSFDNLEELAACPQVDAVYIASPNYAHCRQALLLLAAGKHVLCEKPMASNASEVRKMQACAREHNVLLLEAMKSAFVPGFAALSQSLSLIGRLRRITASYCQYSSRYDKFKQGIVLNAFDPKLSNGALMDIGVYCVYPVVKLFGMPRTIQGTAVKLTGGVDGAGSILLGYGDFQADLLYSKITDGALPSEFQGEGGSLLVDRISEPQSISIRPRGQETRSLYAQPESTPMRYEIEAFQRLALEPASAESYSRATLETAMVMEEARRQMGIVFPADAQ
ncbi:MAG: Gfo/Idh/MocA family protein [Candidatus Spyradocola sp.]|jgi:predicted dehydrogenase